MKNRIAIRSQKIREAILSGLPKSGPPSLKSRWARARYIEPAGLKEAFDAALPIIERESARQEARAQKLEKKLEQSGLSENQRSQLKSALEEALVKSELYSPETRYNFLVQDVDMSIPVFRHLAKGQWKAKELLVLMQRLEQHHVIPDTLPTFEPRAAVKLQFPTPQARAIEPGEVLATAVCERRMQLEVQEFDAINAGSLYTVVVVNPDTPDLANDSFKTQLHYAAVDVPLSNGSPAVNFDAEGVKELKKWLPAHPEKNAGAQRLCVWVFRQSEPSAAGLELENAGLGENFDIRKFAQQNKLDAVGAHMWRVRYDMATDAIRSKYNLGPGNVYYRARTARPEEALLHVRHRQQWRAVDERRGQ